MGLRLRLLLIIVVGLGTSFALSLTLLVRVERQVGEEAAVHRSAALLSTLVVPVSLLLTQGRVPDLDNLMSALNEGKNELDLSTIFLLDMRGIIIATSEDRLYGRAPGDPFSMRATTSPRIEVERDDDGFPLRVSVPVATGVRWGTLIGEVSKTGVAARIQETQTRIVVTALVVSVIGLIILLLILSFLVVKPIRDVFNVAKAIADGNLRVRAEIKGGDEIATLARVINQGADRLERYTGELESEVKKRTEELELANQELIDANTRLERLATTDGLTRLFNHRHFHHLLQREVERQRRSRGQFALVMIDVDHFKHFNDSHGHPTGDELLRVLGRLLKENTRSTDVVGRYGGEEFVVLLLDVERESARVRAEEIRALVAEHPFAHGDQQPLGHVSISLGVSLFPEHGETVRALIATADRALYTSKHDGRDRVTVAAPPETPLTGAVTIPLAPAKDAG